MSKPNPDLLLVGFGSRAKVGKDFAGEIAGQVVHEFGGVPRRFAFADILKSDMERFIYGHFGISVWTKNSAEKDLIRPMLVAYGEARRAQKPSYWIDRLTSEITDAVVRKPRAEGRPYVAVVTDVRYLNEAMWIINRGGVLIDIDAPGIGFANASEAKYSPLVREVADFRLTNKFTHEFAEQVRDTMSHILTLHEDHGLDQFLAENRKRRQRTKAKNCVPCRHRSREIGIRGSDSQGEAEGGAGLQGTG